jgi:tetratricopeptide (TPR) repeat protein
MTWRVVYRQQRLLLLVRFFFLLFTCASFFVYGDELVLTDGQTISGEIIEESVESYTVVIGSMSLNVSKVKVQSVKRVDRLTNLLARGDRLTSAGIYGKAIEVYQEALSLSKGNAEIERKIAKVRRMEFMEQMAPADKSFVVNNYGDATTLYQKLLERFPEDEFSHEIKIKLSEVYCYRAETALDRIDYAQATEFLQKALDLNPGSTSAHLVMAKYE